MDHSTRAEVFGVVVGLELQAGPAASFRFAISTKTRLEARPAAFHRQFFRRKIKPVVDLTFETHPLDESNCDFALMGADANGKYFEPAHD